jgi:5,10-methylene-tetrahydrofolate dehydrogenase/methenyl tetrahydrofolate cyclohydrolase
MVAVIIDGQSIANKITESLNISQSNIHFVIISFNKPSFYVSALLRNPFGIKVSVVNGRDCNVEQICEQATAILIEKPIPGEYKYLKVALAKKDIETPFSPVAEAVDFVLKEYSISLEKRVLVIGRSTGLEIAQKLIHSGYTVTVANSKTFQLSQLIGEFDVVISSTGIHGLIKAEWLKKDSVFFDVGGGDLEDIFPNQCKLFAPKFNGIGPITIAMTWKFVFNKSW